LGLSCFLNERRTWPLAIAYLYSNLWLFSRNEHSNKIITSRAIVLAGSPKARKPARSRSIVAQRQKAARSARFYNWACRPACWLAGRPRLG